MSETKRSLAAQKRARIECLGDRFVVSDDGRGTQSRVRHPDTGALLKPIMASADLRY